MSNIEIDLSQMQTAETRLQEKRAGASLDRFTFAMTVAQHPDIAVSFDEAAQWAAGNTIPAPIDAIIDTLPEQQQGPARVDILARPIVRRTGNLMPAIAAAYSVGEDVLDQIFGIE